MTQSERVTQIGRLHKHTHSDTAAVHPASQFRALRIVRFVKGTTALHMAAAGKQHTCTGLCTAS